MSILIGSNDCLRQGLPDSIDLRDMSTTLNTDPGVNFAEAILAQQKEILQTSLPRNSTTPPSRRGPTLPSAQTWQ